MCGIIGLNFKPKESFIDIINIMKNRGIDNISYKDINGNHFGHTRLSIIDIDDEANQPMVFDDIVIVFNGEIYNYRELKKDEELVCQTKSDTEVIIRLYQKYGIEFLNKLNGAFAFCIYDIKIDRYFCARDRYGKKPFYYYCKDGKFIFASMIKPIIKSIGFTPPLNKIALSQYLQYFTPLAPNTFYTDILKLDSSSYLIYENGNLLIKKYYQIKTKKIIYNEDEALKSIEDTLLKSIEDRMVSDVEIGSLLSGGIDSSLVSTIYSKISNKQIKTYSIGYEGMERYSELPFASIVAKDINSIHTAIYLTQKEYISCIDEVFEALEEPHSDHASIPLYFMTKMIKKDGIKTVFSGEGSDELFLGYNNYAKFYEYYRFKQTLSKEQKSFLKQNLKNTKTTTKEIEYLKRVLNDELIYNSFGEIFTLNQKKRLFKKVPQFSYFKEKKDPIDWMSYIDLKVWLGESLLSKVDKISMANSVECRNPFLDVNLVDLSFKIDSKLKLGDTNKYLLKKIALKYIPKEIVSREKKGFNSPYNEWLNKEFKDDILNEILKANKLHNLFDIEYIKELYIASLNNKQKQHIYSLWVFSRWYNINYG